MPTFIFIARTPVFLLRGILFAFLCMPACSLAQRTAPQQDPRETSSNSKPLPASTELKLPRSPPSIVPDHAPGIAPVRSTVEVDANDPNGPATSDAPMGTQHITQAEMLSAAGTLGDFTRNLQQLPGVVWNGDQSNDVLVRGGHPSENLFVVDGIEVPNLNHIAVEGTSGGFTSMVDTAAVASMDLKAGVYDAKYSSRLSSLIEIHTIGSPDVPTAAQLNFGISGAGGLLQRALGPHANLLLSVHHSLLNLATDNVGLNGTPVYTNSLGQLEWSPSAQDRISALSISGVDSIDINPCAGDVDETLNINTQYAGWRSTDGFTWQHTHTPTTVSTLTSSYSVQSQHIGQQLQQTDGQYHNTGGANNCTALVSTGVYNEQTRDGISTLSYSLQHDQQGWFISAGITGRLTSLDYAVAQPVGQQSPFNVNPAFTDATNFTRNFATGQTGSYIEATGHIAGRWTVMAGAREETFALSSAHLFEPRASVAFRISQHHALNVEYGRASQLSPYIDILSYSQNASLRPEQVEQYSVGADLWRSRWVILSADAYSKHYSHEPVSTEYPSLMLANMVDTLGQEFIWLPLKTGGRGKSEGVDMSLRAHLGSRIQLFTATTYARTRYAAADGVLRPGNFDVPLVANGMLTTKLPGALELVIHNTYASGRPYTPFDIPDSEAQFRGIYDLTQVNRPRGSTYNRLDIEANRNIHIRRGILNIHGGADNFLNRNNFLGYAWLERCPTGVTCGVDNVPKGPPMQKLYQMPIFPLFGARYSF